MSQVKLGVIRETKIPPDKRVPLTPKQCREMLKSCTGLEIFVQPSKTRCFSDDEYMAEGIELKEDLSDCDVLMGVKEVKIDTLLNNKTYLFFSHTAKKQPYNRKLLQSIVSKGIRLVDYEYLTGEDQVRVVAFGRWAGVVGAYNGLRAHGVRFEGSQLRPASLCHDLNELKSELQKLDLGKTRIAITGGGRVAGGATEILDAAGVRQVEPEEYLKKEFDHAVYTRLDPWHYTSRRDGSEFDFGHFISHPEMYVNSFRPYAARTDLFVACHFWDPKSPILLSPEDLAGGEVPISIIADISCDIKGPIPSTIRASTIADPYYGYDPISRSETDPFRDGSITVMAVDNLPGELPRDASTDFGEALMEHVIPELVGLKETGMLERASITRGGALTERYAYLQRYLEGTE
ncbi:MAG: NAD(P)-dependent oxidoreductase [Bacteroidota bacterium]